MCNPDTQIPVLTLDDDGEVVCDGYDTPHLSPVQKKLWEWHTKDIEKVRELANDDEIILLEMGDLTQGNLFKDDLAETSLEAQYFIAKASLYPWLELPNLERVYVVLGTSVHNWGVGSSETMLTHHLMDEYPDKKFTVSNHYLMSIDEFKIDVAHHGPGPGIRNWTRGNVLRLYSESILSDDIAYGVAPPNLLLRAHFHEFVAAHATRVVGDKLWELPAYIAPPYCFIGAHAIKACKSPTRMSVGVLAFEIINGRLMKTYPFLHTVDLRTKEVL